MAHVALHVSDRKRLDRDRAKGVPQIVESELTDPARFSNAL